MCPVYEVFICHRGPDTKRNVVSVLSGMLCSEGISCFVDYEMQEGTDIKPGIYKAIDSSLVYIIVLSPTFASSKWCLDEVVHIMNIQRSGCTSKAPRRVFPVLYDVRLSVVRQQVTDLAVKRSTPEEREQWDKALEDLSHIQGMEYCIKTTFQWDKLEEIVVEVESFLKGTVSLNIRAELAHGRSYDDTKGLEVFICHLGLDTGRTVVSVLCGLLRSKRITFYVTDEMENEAQINSGIDEAIQKSRVYVVVLSKNFTSSKSCLDAVLKIMNTLSWGDTSRSRTVLPIFCDVNPSEVRYHKAEVKGSTTKENERWSKALHDLSEIKGFEYDSKTMFLWEKLQDIVREVKASLKKANSHETKQKCENSYAKQIHEVQQVLESDKSKDVFLVGVYGSNKAQFVKLLIDKLSDNFNAFCKLSNVMEKYNQGDRFTDLIKKVYADLILDLNEESPNYDEYESNCEHRLQNKKCLIVLHVVGNDIDQIRRLLALVKVTLQNGSLVVLTSQFEHILTKVVKVDKLIRLRSLEDTSGILTVCYGDRRDINEAFFSYLQETFSMVGLDVHFLGKEEVVNNSTSLQNAQVILCIISKGFSIGDSEILLRNAAINRPKIFYVSYGSHPNNESTSNIRFDFKVSFEEATGQLHRLEFKLMVYEVLRTLKKGGQKMMDVTDFPVGLRQAVNEIETWLFRHPPRSNWSLRCFGLLGMGGAGKTTIAKSIYNRMHSEFEGSCFCLNIRAYVATKYSGLVDMQKKILNDIVSKQFREKQIIDEDNGKMVLASELKGINALIVLDDVDSMSHIEALYQPLCSLGANSVVIITSRDRSTLESAQPEMIFEINGLSNREDSERLFYWHAFLKPEPPAHLKEVSHKVIDACRGLPLSLKSIGAHLYHNSDKCFWEESLHFLQQNENEIFNVLRVSFDGLKCNEKEAFLDISCFLIGEEEEIACLVLEGCYGIGRTHLNLLKSKCLISIDYDRGGTRVIAMHDQLRDMGRHIIQERRPNRAWNAETAERVLKDKRARSALRGLSVFSTVHFPKVVAKCTSLPQLKILVLDGRFERTYRESEFLLWERTFLREESEDVISAKEFLENMHCHELRWLRWWFAPFEEVPRGLRSAKLVVLDLSHSENLRKLPIVSVSNLQRLELGGCGKLEELPEMSALRYLNLSRCGRLKCLASSIGRSTDLKSLNLRSCTSLAFLPQDMTGFFDLQEINVSYCKSLSRLPFLPTALKILNAAECESLQSIDEVRLPTLLQLHLHSCSNLKVLKASIPKIAELNLLNCSKLKSFNVSAASMQRLDLGECSALDELDCKDLCSLQVLGLSWCDSLRTLCFLPTTLQELLLMGCRKLEDVDVGALSNLEKLDIRDCPHLLSRFPDKIGSLPSLQIWR
ncbi:hypothetical protein KP509_15G029400 [Ceratopteris richardii]|uniref:TIR domain-containing protein n=1 Tax=Ceratopteris richardii TaxID=49495 RepID=A0A8T2T829_CERRI|nr:hypothetical protein KP509_15G029400 [Ceratopteris richardii]KAH7404512.1 hypothetical protein KP509_15G029400 [Ceratopteris richardii]KAH7404513.1 hypothetical protein KP509_15G029400 [Ceratopteris richardii]